MLDYRRCLVVRHIKHDIASDNASPLELVFLLSNSTAQTLKSPALTTGNFASWVNLPRSLSQITGYSVFHFLREIGITPSPSRKNTMRIGILHCFLFLGLYLLFSPPSSPRGRAIHPYHTTLVPTTGLRGYPLGLYLVHPEYFISLVPPISRQRSRICSQLPNLATEATSRAPCPRVAVRSSSSLLEFKPNYFMSDFQSTNLPLFRLLLHCRGKNADARVCES
ncbi:hypothetical protein J6590_020111 [Homalodisca vitripennis]|nr:hypothetical protein J6590_020111 [Homalodisca vitripennis]